MSHLRHPLRLILSLGLLLPWGLACSGGGGGGGDKPPGPPVTATVIVSPEKASLAVGTSAQLQVSGSNLGTITWSVVESGGGTINGSGLTGTYQAPSASGVFHVKASSSNPTGEATATLEVLSAGDAANIGLRIVPSKFTVQAQASVRVGSRGRGKKEVIPPPPVAAVFDEVDVNATYVVQEGPVGGRVDSMGNYSAPSQPGVHGPRTGAGRSPEPGSPRGCLQPRCHDVLSALRRGAFPGRRIGRHPPGPQ